MSIYKPFNVEHPQVQLAFVLKLSQLRSEYNLELEYFMLEKIFKNYLWKEKAPENLSSAINDIFSLTINKIVSLLSTLEYKESFSHSLDDYKEVYSK